MDPKLETALLHVETELEELAKQQALVADRWSYVAEAWAEAEKVVGVYGNQLTVLHIRRKQKEARNEHMYRSHSASVGLASELRELRAWINMG